VLLVVALRRHVEGLSETVNPVLRKRPIAEVDLEASSTPSVEGS